MNKIIPITLGLLFALQVTICAQVDFRASSKIGISTDDALFDKKTSIPALSGLLEMTIDKSIYKHFFVGGGLNVNLVRLKDKEARLSFEQGFYVQGNQFVYVPESTYTNDEKKRTTVYNVGYLGLPVYVGVNIRKFSIKTGFQTSYKVFGQKVIKEKKSNDSEQTVTKEKTDNLSNFDFGPTLSIGFQLAERLVIEGFYYHGIKDVHEGGAERKVRQGGLGCSWRLN